MRAQVPPPSAGLSCKLARSPYKVARRSRTWAVPKPLLRLALRLSPWLSPWLVLRLVLRLAPQLVRVLPLVLAPRQEVPVVRAVQLEDLAEVPVAVQLAVPVAGSTTPSLKWFKIRLFCADKPGETVGAGSRLGL